MLKRRLIPKLQLRKVDLGGKRQLALVTTVQFDKTVLIGNPVSQAKIYEAQSVDELIFVDIDATVDNRMEIIEVIKKVSEEIFMPITVGGGIVSLDGFRELLKSGADKVSINTSAIETPELITAASEMFGAQCVVVSIDYKRDDNGSYYVWSRCGKMKTALNPLEWAAECVRRGAGELLITSIDRDGTRTGLDLEMTRLISENISVPVIAAGGCGAAKHFIDGFIEGKADAVSAGTYFCMKDENPMQCRAQIRNADIPIRIKR